MLLMPSEFHHNIINVYLHNLADELMENIIHGSLICGTSIFQPKVITPHSNKPTCPGHLNAIL
jgi:hypothetical protein